MRPDPPSIEGVPASVSTVNPSVEAGSEFELELEFELVFVLTAEFASVGRLAFAGEAVDPVLDVVSAGFVTPA